jgi:hypothetical protein
MLFTLQEIGNYVNSLAERIGAPATILPTYGRTDDGARPHVEIRDGELFYVIVERGEELKRVRTVEIDHLLYLIFSDVTFSMAVKFEYKHRNALQDFRRILFAKQEELLGLLNPAWREKEQMAHQTILSEYPFDDEVDEIK